MDEVLEWGKLLTLKVQPYEEGFIEEYPGIAGKQGKIMIVK